MSVIVNIGDKRGEIYRNGVLDYNEELWDKLMEAFDDFDWEDEVEG